MINIEHVTILQVSKIKGLLFTDDLAVAFLSKSSGFSGTRGEYTGRRNVMFTMGRIICTHIYLHINIYIHVYFFNLTVE